MATKLLRKLWGVLLVISVLPAGVLQATEVYVLRFRTNVSYVDPPCKIVDWRDELLFHNGANDPKLIRNLAATAGTASPPGQLLIPAGRTRSTLSERGFELGGDPFGATIVVNRLDVPDGVAVASRADVFGPPPTCPAPTPTVYSFGSVPLPVVRSLAPANERQVHLTADLGIQARRTNVIVYNGGPGTATVRIEFRAGCDDSLISERLIGMGPNSVAQVGGFTDEPLTRSCGGESLTTEFTRYVVVTADQPSFSHVMTVSNEFLTPTIGVTSASGQ